jgi:hypothetical protein
MSTKKKHNSGLKTAVEVGAGLGLAAMAGVGALMMGGGKRAEKNKKKLKAFTGKVHREAVAEFKMMKGANRAAYKKAANIAHSHYKQFQKVDKPKIKKIASDLRGQWKAMGKKMKEASMKKSTALKPKKKKTARA